MNCSGIHVATGEFITLDFEDTIHRVRLSGSAAEGVPWLSPGFVDIQVNGFAGIDFNSPGISLADISLALETILRTGVTRCLPTVVTGPPDDMLACLRNLR